MIRDTLCNECNPRWWFHFRVKNTQILIKSHYHPMLSCTLRNKNLQSNLSMWIDQLVFIVHHSFSHVQEINREILVKNWLFINDTNLLRKIFERFIDFVVSWQKQTERKEKNSLVICGRSKCMSKTIIDAHRGGTDSTIELSLPESVCFLRRLNINVSIFTKSLWCLFKSA